MASRSQQLKEGIKIESEHRGTVKYIISKCHKGKCPSYREIFKKIASDHLSEESDYYTRLKKAKL